MYFVPELNCTGVTLKNEYEAMVRKYDICPILLFNEADAIINKRSENTNAAVDKMENACQNIILQAEIS